MPAEMEFESQEIEKSELQYCYILKNKIHPDGVVINALGERILDEIDNSSSDADDLFLGQIGFESEGLWLWLGTIIYPLDQDEPVFHTKSLEKVPFATLDNDQQSNT